MYYFDYLRVLRALRIFALIAGGIVLLQLVSLPFSHASNGDVTIGVSGDSIRLQDFRGYALMHRLAQSVLVPFALLCSIAAALAAIFAYSLSASLARYNGNLHFSFTKPVSRERSAFTTIGIDAAAIVVAYAVALFLLLVPFAAVGVLDRLTFDGHAPANAALGLGIAFLWYGCLQAATAGMRTGSGLVLGLSWPFFIVIHALGGLTDRQIPAFFVAVLAVLNKIDPLSYLDLLFDRLGDFHGHVPPLDPNYAASLATVWLVAAAGIAIAVVSRKRLEI